ncbi:hypothetical protein [Paenibacillus agaridevorans]|uniref:hypothetical protein n=1 Tax=Paenibacillus agaridevorans TaxID=171404 RepID=UPI001BE3F94F|nr:hypothetical protein [Paenibacillus agaridevorans]
MKLKINVTRSGLVYVTDKGKNTEIRDSYKFCEGYLRVERVNSGENVLVIISRFFDGREIYKYEIYKPGKYMVLHNQITKHIDIPPDVRNLYNQLKVVQGRPKFKLDQSREIEDAFIIDLKIWNDRGLIEKKYYILVNPQKLVQQDVGRIVDLMNRVEIVELHTILAYFGSKDPSISLKVDEKLFSKITDVEKQIKVEES